MISEASRRAREAFCSPSAAMTFALASLDASAYSMIHEWKNFYLHERISQIPLQPLLFAIEPEGAHPFCNTERWNKWLQLLKKFRVSILSSHIALLFISEWIKFCFIEHKKFFLDIKELAFWEKKLYTHKQSF